MINGKYTIVLKTLMDSPSVMNKLNEALSEYELYVKTSNENKMPSYIPTREQLNKKLLEHYKYREIGFETPGRFIDELRITMNEIMPYYNQLFHSVDHDYDITYNVDYTRTITGEKAGTNRDVENGSVNQVGESSSSGTNTSSANDETFTDTNTTNNNKNVKSSTPQNSLDIGATDINNVEYADEIGFNQDLGSQSGQTSGNSNTESNSSLEANNTNNTTTANTVNGEHSTTESSTEVVQGNYGQISIPTIISQYRDTIKNIEQELITCKEIADLFMSVY